MSMDADDKLDLILDPSDRGGGPARWVIGLISIMVVAAFAGVVWYIYGEGIDRRAGVAPPLIKAPAGPTKVAPDEPGGLQVPNQDKQVYQAIQTTRSEPKLEQLLPPPEMPQPEVEIEPARPANVAVATAGSPAPKPVATASTSTDSPATPPAPAEPDQTIAEVDPAPAVTPQATLAARQFLVQLAAFRDPAPADTVWRQLRRKHPKILGDMKHRLQMIDLGAEKGVFYRLQVDGYATRSAAIDVCEQLKARDQGCLVVRR